MCLLVWIYPPHTQEAYAYAITSFSLILAKMRCLWRWNACASVCFRVYIVLCKSHRSLLFHALSSAFSNLWCTVWLTLGNFSLESHVLRVRLSLQRSEANVNKPHQSLQHYFCIALMRVILCIANIRYARESIVYVHVHTLTVLCILWVRYVSCIWFLAWPRAMPCW